MYYRLALAAIMAIVMVSLVACGGGDGKRPATPSAVPQTATPTAASTAAASPATAEPGAADTIAAVRADLATRVGEVEVQHMDVISITRHDWPDACLGLTSPLDGVCAQAMIPGYEITIDVPLRGLWIFRTDLHSRVSLANVIAEPSAADAIAAVRADLATRVSEQNARTMPVISITRHDWPDACLGLTSPGDGLCAQVITPGYEITMGSPLGGTWIFRTDLHARVSLANMVPEG